MSLLFLAQEAAIEASMDSLEKEVGLSRSELTLVLLVVAVVLVVGIIMLYRSGVTKDIIDSQKED